MENKDLKYSDQFSCIVSVYNRVIYQRQCRALLKILLDKVEIILVDDESTDSSGNILACYLKANDFIKVIYYGCFG
ncbi:glycosyltransferase [Parabacteroides segnis]|uniref:glycosyltransferase n=1 Tax=Parabacteroides segnis TaxID=2763058 RepID=UPI0035112353